MKKILLMLVLFLVGCSAMSQKLPPGTLSLTNEKVAGDVAIVLYSEEKELSKEKHRSIVTVYEKGQSMEFIKSEIIKAYAQYKNEKLVLVTMVMLNPFSVRHFVLNYKDNSLIEMSIIPMTETETYGSVQVLFPMEYVIEFFVNGQKSNSNEFFVLDQMEFKLSTKKLLTLLKKLSNGKLFKDS